MNLRGRNADTPAQIPFQGYKDVILRVKDEISADRLGLVSAAMSYYALLALVPSLTALVLIYALLFDPSEIVSHVSKISAYLPEEVQAILKEQLTALSSRAKSTLSLSMVSSLLLAWFGSSKAASAVIEALNIIYDEKEERSFLILNLTAFLLALSASIFSILALVVIVAVPAVISVFNFGETFEKLLGSLSWVGLIVLFASFLGVVYRYAPCRKAARWSWISPGAIVSVILWSIVSLLFAWYAASFADFNKTYGSLGAIVALMTWFYLSSFVILLGAEVNAELEHQTLRDTTTDVPSPLGMRGAQMADTVGKSFGKFGKALHKLTSKMPWKRSHPF